MAELLYINLSNEIERQIRTGILQENEKLSERKLAGQYGVSRTVIREALKLLNQKGLVTIKSGKGNYVTIPNEQDMMDRIEDLFDQTKVELLEIVEAREILEYAMAERLIGRISQDDISELEKMLQEMSSLVEDGTEFARADARFHLKLMSCARNSVLELFTGALNKMTDRQGILYSREVRADAQAKHIQMLEMIRSENQAGLKQAIMDHLACIKGQIEAM